MAAQLPPVMEPRKGCIYYFKHDNKFMKSVVFPINHLRRLKRLLKKDDIAGINRYMAKYKTVEASSN